MKQPTKRQAKVLDGIDKGKTPEQIAKQMGITTNGVYGHMRRLRANGLIDSDGHVSAAASDSGSPNGSSRNGSPEKAPALVQMEALVKDAIGTAEDRLTIINQRRTAIKEDTELLAAEDRKLAEEEEKLTAREKALDAALTTS